MWGRLTRRSDSTALHRLSVELLCVHVYVCIYVCSNGVETEAMLEHGATGGRSCYKTCHFLSSSKQWPIRPHIAGKYRLWPAQGQSWNASSSMSWWIYVGLLLFGIIFRLQTLFSFVSCFAKYAVFPLFAPDKMLSKFMTWHLSTLHLFLRGWGSLV